MSAEKRVELREKLTTVASETPHVDFTTIISPVPTITTSSLPECDKKFCIYNPDNK